MITLSILIYIIWTIARFHDGKYMGWSRTGYITYGPWYAHLWDLVHLLAAIIGVSYFIIKHFK